MIPQSKHLIEKLCLSLYSATILHRRGLPGACPSQPGHRVRLIVGRPCKAVAAKLYETIQAARETTLVIPALAAMLPLQWSTAGRPVAGRHLGGEPWHGTCFQRPPVCGRRVHPPTLSNFSNRCNYVIFCMNVRFCTNIKPFAVSSK
jgi:hypothetical protein